MESLLDYTLLGLAVKARNALFDTVFYDVNSLTFEEWMGLNPLADRKGKIIVVSPTGSKKKETIRHYKSAQTFLKKEGNSVFAVVVTGVGSSVVGTAALARNVADACKGMVGEEVEDVAGVVSGFGASDVVQEGLGGYFFYGMLNQCRFLFETAMENANAIISDSFAKATNIRDQVGKIFGTPLPDYVPIGVDVHALEHILDALRAQEHEHSAPRGAQQGQPADRRHPGPHERGIRGRAEQGFPEHGRRHPRLGRGHRGGHDPEG